MDHIDTLVNRLRAYSQSLVKGAKSTMSQPLMLFLW